MTIPQFIFGGTTGINSPEELARRRLVAQALKLQAAGNQPKNLGEGIGAVADAISARRANAGLDEAATAGAESAQTAIAKALGGAGAFPAAPTSPSAAPASAPSTPYAGDLKGGIESTAAALGIDPIDLGTAISYETGGTFDPTKAGPTTQWGQHKGFIQFGEPQAKKYGVDWKNPVGSQLGPDGAVAKYLRDTGVKPGMGLLDIYSAINAGGVGKYNASDAKNGGAPGTVRDKVEQQMAAHRAKALALLGGGNQVASLDPGIGINPPAGAVNPDPGISAQPPMALANTDPGILANPAKAAIAQALARPPVQQVQAQSMADPVGAPVGTTPAGQRVMGQMMSPLPIGGQSMQMQPPQGAPPLPTRQVGPDPMGAPAPDNLPVMAGGNADAIPKGQLPSIQDLMQAAQNPWLNDQQRGVVNMLLKQQMDRADPNNQLDAEYKRAQIEALKAKPDQTPESVRALQIRAQAAGLREGSPEYQQFMMSGGALKAENKPSGIQEYEYAKSQGFPGTFQDWEASKKGGMSLQVDPATGAVTFQQGGNIKPMTEAQSKDTTYATRAAGALPLVDQFGDALTNLTESTGGKMPVIGNYMKSPEYQKAEQAGNEFLQAVLRKDTGAAITAGEMAEYGSVYLPRPGDSPELLAQKKASRTRALEAMKAGMTPQAILAQEKAIAASGGAPSTSEPPKKRLKFNPATGELE